MSFIQCSLDRIPKTESIRKQSGIPFYIVYTPQYAPVQKIPTEKLARCSKCRGYMNKYNTLIAPNKWQCCLCDTINTEKSIYYDLSEGTQKYPELSVESFEIVTDTNFTRRPMQDVCVVFAVDSILWESTKTIIKDAVIKLSEKTKVGILVYGSNVSLIKVVRGKYSVDVFVEEPDDIICNVETYLTKACDLTKVLDLFDTISFPASVNQSVFGLAMKTVNCLLGSRGGKVICIHGSQPTGQGSLQLDSETLDSTHSEYYTDLSVLMNNNMITIDLFLSLHTSYDTATLCDFVRRTGGRTHVISNFGVLRHTMTRDIVQSVCREAVFRVRTTENMTTVTRYGNFNMRNNDLLAVPCVEPSSCLVVEYEILSDFSCTKFYIQTVFLYTNENKERVLRIQTTWLPYGNAPEINCTALTIACSNVCVEIAKKKGILEAKKYLEQIARNVPKYCKDRDQVRYNLFCLLKSPILKMEKNYITAAHLREMRGNSQFPIPVLYTLDSFGGVKIVSLSQSEVTGKLCIFVFGDYVTICVDKTVEKKVLKKVFGVTTITEIAENFHITEDKNEVAESLLQILKSMGERCVTVDCSEKWKEWLVVDPKPDNTWDYQSFILSLGAD
ncbi:hypothetical protein EIN_485460 [Entamoeba invadens IP1]|uniref:Protein transport protein SEC24 n=1 Tax=Entamoeba invadens IP1 TaxID=370355 RepID=A0A0A1U4N0_ENTIV|nr:hypothetical protein EIN_485460 [Entamoeba invadens IP1]ELP89154.1 hypothetical protein EIN_485460 [Entamoeba invadens IP1]|eukprot:XP_004255925.1 hypothetical protein EIN_485460 [Entamoeba invadens IP1]